MSATIGHAILWCHHWSCCHAHCFAFHMPCSVMLWRHCNAANSFRSHSISAAVPAEEWRHVGSKLRCLKHNITHAHTALRFRCHVSDAMFQMPCGIPHEVVNENWAGMFSQSFLFWTSHLFLILDFIPVHFGVFGLEAGVWCLLVVL